MKRKLLVGLCIAVIVPFAVTAFGDDDPMTTEISVSWEQTGEPVVGAGVFRMPENELLGFTGSSGRFVANVVPGTSLRVVEPQYGVQQASLVANGGFIWVAWTLGYGLIP